MPPPQASTVSRYLLAVAVTAAAIALRWILDPWLGDHLPLVTLFAAVAAAVWFGGYGPALLATALGYVACTYLFIEPRGAFLPQPPAVALGSLAYLVTCSVIIGFGEAMRRAQAQARARRDLLSVTLANIGDAVITTAHEGRIAFMNPVAEALTGCQSREAIGQPLESVFRIIDEGTRAAAEIGLANPTLLVAKNGTEHPIDHSAAPIRDESGDLVGCVLVFRDTTLKQRAEHDLAASEHRYRTIFDTTGVSLWEEDFSGVKAGVERLKAQGVTDFAGYLEQRPEVLQQLLEAVRVVDVNEFTVRMFEAEDKAQLLGSLRKIFPPESLHVFVGEIVALAEGRRYFESEALLNTLRGRPLHVLFTMVLPGTDERYDRVLFSLLDISDRKRAEMSLKEADRRKDEFLATLAHELRNPLAPVRNALEIMKVAGVDSGLATQARDIMDRQVGQMERLIDDLLDISRITRNKLELRKQRVELGPVLQQAIEACRPVAESSRHKVLLSLPAESLVLSADAVRLAQAFGNLLHNACKFTPAGGRIEVGVERLDDEVVVSVKDSGIGIAVEMLPRIFDMFTQVERSLEQSHGGLGIGLTLVRQIVELHGGQVEARSDGAGRGSEFRVRLPILTDAVEIRPRAATVPISPPQARRVLIVDDNKDNADSLATLLKLAGQETCLAHDGRGAIEAAQRFRPELVLLDIGLPGLSGFDACRRIREQPWGRSMRLVALTGWGQEEDRRQSTRAGFDGHMVKPVDPMALMQLLASLPERGADNS